jgi:hypothetical protein
MAETDVSVQPPLEPGDAPATPDVAPATPDVAAPLLAPPPPVRPPPPETEVPIDEERAILSAAIPGSEKGARKLRGEAKQLIRSGSALGRFAAQRILSKADRRESELLNHRAKVAFYDTAALCVNVYYNELGKPKPNKVVLDGAMAAMRGAGIVVDSTPLSQDDRAKAVDEAREVSNMEPAELLSRVTQRLAAMRSKPAGAS